MTNYNAWEKKANELAAEAEEDDKQEKTEADAACGLQDGPQGPPTAKAKKERKELTEKSEERKEFIDWQDKMQNEVPFTHTNEKEPIEFKAEDVEGKSVRLTGSKDTTYVLPDGISIKKLYIDKCSRVVVKVSCAIPTSTIEIYKCDDVELDMSIPVGTIQADECEGAVRVRSAEYEHVGSIYHQNCGKLSVGWGSGDDFIEIGRAGPYQLVTRRKTGSKDELLTQAVQRGEGEFPMDLGNATATPPENAEPRGAAQPEPEEDPENDPEVKRALADAKREKGNEMFRASDFLQAAVEYSFALELDPSLDVVWANRAQCWLKTGDLEAALKDSIKCTEVNPKNAKGWFRKGMSLHAQKKYQEAIPAMLQAEDLDPKNLQIQQAVKMAQLMARKQPAN